MRLSIGATLFALCAACGGQISETSDAGAADVSDASANDVAAPASRVDPCFVGAGQCLYLGQPCRYSVAPSSCGPGLFCCVPVPP